jgi:hypothetical protein
VIIRVKGYSDGIKDYLENGQKSGRFFARDELDERVTLQGDLDFIDNIIQSMDDTHGNKYTNFTFSFKEDFVSNEMLQSAVDEFIKYYFSSYDDDEICYYAEAHLPKIKSYNDANNNLIERKPHIHLVVPRINLKTGEYISYNEKITEKYRDAFQEYFNCKYGFESPKNNKRYKINDSSEYISRYKGDGFIGASKQFRQELLNKIIDNDIRSKEQFLTLLYSLNCTIKVRNANNKDKLYFNVINDGISINLRDNVFKESFFLLTKDEKINYLKFHTNLDVANQYLEQKNNSGNVPKVYTDLMHDWTTKQNLYWRYARKFTSNEKKLYKSLSEKEQVSFLQNKHNLAKSLVKEFNKLSINSELLNNEYRRITSNNLISIKRVNESSNHDASRINGLQTGVISRRRDEFKQRLTRNNRFNWRSEDGYQSDYRSTTRLNNSETIYAAKSVNEDYYLSTLINKKHAEKLSFKSLIANYNEDIDANVLLEYLEKSHGLNPEIYRITVNSKGSDRIGAGSRNFSVFDFCRKEVNLPWQQTISILNNTLDLQRVVERDKTYSHRSKKYLWADYQIWLKQFNLRPFNNNEFTILRKSIYQRYNKELSQLRRNKSMSSSAKQSLTQSILFAKELELNDLSETIKQSRIKARAKYNKDMQDSYRKFLLELAKNKDNNALEELRRLRIDYSTYQDSNCISYVARYEEYMLNLSHEVDKNGVINYKVEDSIVIKDHGKWIESVRTNEENIKLVIDLAFKKFGNKLCLRGKDSFKDKVIDKVLKEGLNVVFTDDYSKLKYQSKLEALRSTNTNLEDQKMQLVQDSPTKLVISDIRKANQLINNKLVETSLIEVKDIETNRKYLLSGFYVHFKASKLKPDDNVDFTFNEETNDIKLSIKPEYKLKRQLRQEALNEIQQKFIQKHKNSKQLIIGTFLRTGKNKKNSWTLIKSSTGKLIKIINDDLNAQLISSKKGDQIAIAQSQDITTTQLVKDKAYIITIVPNDIQRLANNIQFNDKLITGKIYKKTEFTYADGAIGQRIALRNIHSNKVEVLFTKVPCTYSVGQVVTFENKKVGGWSAIKEISGIPSVSDDRVIGTLTSKSHERIRGKDVFCATFNTIDGHIKKYGPRMQKVLVDSDIKIGDHCQLDIIQQEKEIKVTKEYYKSENCTKTLDFNLQEQAKNSLKI